MCAIKAAPLKGPSRARGKAAMLRPRASLPAPQKSASRPTNQSAVLSSVYLKALGLLGKYHHKLISKGFTTTLVSLYPLSGTTRLILLPRSNSRLIFLSSSVDFPILNMSYKCTHYMVFGGFPCHSCWMILLRDLLLYGPRMQVYPFLTS